MRYEWLEYNQYYSCNENIYFGMNIIPHALVGLLGRGGEGRGRARRGGERGCNILLAMIF